MSDTHDASGEVVGPASDMSNSPAEQELERVQFPVTEPLDLDAAVDQSAVTSTIEVSGTATTRTYSDGAVQRNVWASKALAQEYADSVAQAEGNN